MIDEVREDGMTYAPPPARFEAGTPPIAQAVGLGLALDYIEAIGRDAISAHEHELLTYAMEKIRQINAVRIMGEAPGKGAIISFEVEGRTPTTSRPCLIAQASPCAPAPIARSRC